MAERGDFGPVSEADWRARVERDLKGRDFRRTLVARTYEGLEIEPVYHPGNAVDAPDRGAPGAWPYVRGMGTGAWDIRAVCREPEPLDARVAILDEVEQGATSLHLVIDGLGRGNGILVTGLSELSRALEGVDPAQMPIALDAGLDAPVVGAALVAWARACGCRDADLRLELGLDPLGSLADLGAMPGGLANAMDEAADAVSWAEVRAPQVRALAIDTSPYHHAGCAEDQDLAFAVASALEVLRGLEERGIAPSVAARHLVFRLRLGVEGYLGIAKLRAARLLWSRIGEIIGFDEPLRIHVMASERVLTRRDPWVNLLRGTVTTWAGALGGADAISTPTFDEALGLPSEASRRHARNTQNVLMHESHLGRVADPAGGSWFFESMTQRLAERAWSVFQEIEADGGFIAALVTGDIRRRIDGVWVDRARRVATRRDPITGVSMYPALDEKRPDVRRIRPHPVSLSPGDAVPAPGGGRLFEERARRVSSDGIRALAPLGPPTVVEPLPRRRLASGFELFRDASDRLLEETGSRPSVFLASLGPLAEHNARTSFARNLVEAGGLEGVGGADAGVLEHLAERFLASGSRVAVLCGADERYAAEGAAAAAALEAAGAAAVWLAGRPGKNETAWREAGVDGFLYLGCDVLAVLDAMWTEVSK